MVLQSHDLSDTYDIPGRVQVSRGTLDAPRTFELFLIYFVLNQLILKKGKQ